MPGRVEYKMNESCKKWLGRAAVTVLMLSLSLALSVDLISWLSFYDEKRVIQLVALLLFIGLAFPYWGDIFPRAGAVVSWIKYSILIIVVLACLSVWGAQYKRYALLESALFLMLFISTYLFACIAARDFRFVFTVVIALLLAGVFYYVLVSGVYYVSALIGGDIPTWQTILYNFSNVRFLNQVQIWVLPVLLAFIWRRPQLPGLVLWLTYFSIVGWVVLLINSSGAGVAISLAAALVFVAFMSRPARQFSFYSLKIIVIAFALHWFLMYLIPELVNGNGSFSDKVVNNLSLALRDHLWVAAWHQIVESPVLGIGPMHYAANDVAFAMHPHNALLQLAAEWGLPATLILVLLIGYGFWRWLWLVMGKLKTSEDRPGLQEVQMIALTASMVGAAVLSMASGIVVMPLSQLCFVVIIGLVLALYRMSEVQQVIVGVTRVRMAGFGLLVVLTGATLVWAVAPDIKQRWLGVASDSAFPRFWQHGKIGGD